MGEVSVKDSGLQPYVNKSGAFALSVGTSIGWGCLIVSNSEYLAQAGPAGSCIGIAIGMLVMFIMAVNFCRMAEAGADAGGIYTCIKNVFGYDRAFLISWFTGLTYMAMFWANATSVPLFARYFCGGMFSFGHFYTLFGYDVYAGEVILTFLVMIIFAAVCRKSSKLAQALIILMVFLFTAGIAVCFLAALTGGGSGTCQPAFIPDTGAIRQVLKIAFISPWAFVGFESITHSSEEFAFPQRELKKIFIPAIVLTTALYIAVFLLSVTAYPKAYDSWFDYIRDLDALQGIEGLPAFYVAYSYMGNTGIVILMISLLGLVFSSLIGNLTALSRLFYALARDRILPERYATVSEKGIPERAAGLVILLSIPILFVGREAISWIVDITTIGATLLYGFVSAAALRLSRKSGDKPGCIVGTAGFILMIVSGLYIICESVLGQGGISRESQLILIIWSVLGLLYFRAVMGRDHGKRFGKNLTVWIVLVAFIFVLAMLWICEEGMELTSRALVNVRNHYSVDIPIGDIAEDPAMLEYRQNIMRMLLGAVAGVIGVFAVTVGTMLSNWHYVRKCEEEAQRELGNVKNMAYRDPLTGVKSKHAFAEKEAEINESIVRKGIGAFAVVVFDVNGLKAVNDLYGHKAGDQYIKDAAMIICNTYDHSPVYRTGGDEFVALLNGRDYPDRDELLVYFNKQIEENIGTSRPVVSGGMSVFDSETDKSFRTVFERADKLMYERKQQLKKMGAVTRE